jgi:hypothetical protein
MGFDVDDVGAVCAAHAMESTGEAKILAILHNTGYAKGIGAVSVINHFYGRDDIELGAWKGEFGRDGDGDQNQYVSDLINNYDSPVKHYDQVDVGYKVYRKVLASQPDASVKIASIGMTTNLADLMQSGPDEYSDLDGATLVGQKVKEIVWMDGMYNFGCAEAATSHWLGDDLDCHGTAKVAVMNVPDNVKQIFSGVGGNIISGGRLSTCAGDENPCRKAYMNWCGYGNGRSSWDPLATVLAVRGAEATKLRDNGPGHITVDDEGREYWGNDGKPGSSVSQNGEDWELVDLLEDLYCMTGPAPPAPPPGQYYPDVDGMCALDTGKTSGTEPSMSGFGGGDYSAAWDGDVNSFFDYSRENGGWTQATLDQSSVVAHIEFYPRGGEFLDRHTGGRFVGITASGQEVDLATISSRPNNGWNGLSVSTSDSVNAVKYYSPDGGYGNIAEIKAYSACSNAAVV